MEELANCRIGGLIRPIPLLISIATNVMETRRGIFDIHANFCTNNNGTNKVRKKEAPDGLTGLDLQNNNLKANIIRRRLKNSNLGKIN